ncbi:phosphoglucosamine mutase, partial [archaeon]
GENRITIDGVKVFGNNWAFLIRPSGTEPIIRCFIEAKDDAILEKAFKKAKGIIEKALAS